jgi:capsule polysaccharide export protein KpsE/RkpR
MSIHSQVSVMNTWEFFYLENSMNEDLVRKFQELKAKHNELTSEKLKYEAKKEQLDNEIRAIQNKYTEYDLSTVESVEKIIATLTTQLNDELTTINEQYLKLKSVQV